MILIFGSPRRDLSLVGVEKATIGLSRPVLIAERLRDGVIELEAEKMVGHRSPDRVELGLSATGVAPSHV